MTTTLKTCFKCGAERPLSEFYKHKAMADGHLNKCKACAKTDVKANRLNKVEYYRAYDSERGNRQSPEYMQRYREAYPKVYAAHTAVNNAIRDGKLTRASWCEECGNAHNVVAHHDDYDKPLSVRWLCQGFHVQWHRANGPGKKWR